MKFLKWILLMAVLYASLVGCASVPMAPEADNQLRKQFSPPAEGKAGLYIFRDSIFGSALSKMVYIDEQVIGATAPNTFFYKEIPAGEHKLSTQSEFGLNELPLKANSGANYFVRQYMKMGVFVGGANLEQVTEEEGKKAVLECNLAK